MDLHTIGEIIGAVLLLSLKHFLDTSDRRASDRSTDDRLGHIFTELAALRTQLVGIDGKNGLRSDVLDLRGRVDDIQERELARAEAGPRSRARQSKK
jgi:hypothetical protein